MRDRLDIICYLLVLFSVFILPHALDLNTMQKKASGFHSRSLHNGKYDLRKLAQVCPELCDHIIKNGKTGEETLNFANPKSVKLLNTALLQHFYGLEYWAIPDDSLVPAVPGRSEYLHYLYDLIECDDSKEVLGLDIGTGASLIYPCIGFGQYGWKFVASEVNKDSIESCLCIINQNHKLQENIEVRQQHVPTSIFNGIVGPDEKFDFSM